MPKLAKTELRLVAQELGLIESTNAKQERNGTMAFIDPVMSTTSCIMSYTIHENGYVRRKFQKTHEVLDTNHYWPTEHYQLNRTNITRDRDGRNATQRIMATPLEQVAILFKSTINYRKNK